MRGGRFGARRPIAAISVALAAAVALTTPSGAAGSSRDVRVGFATSRAGRAAVAAAAGAVAHIGSLTPAERRHAIDDYWGSGPSTAEKLATFDTFWTYADRKFASFQGINVDWNGLRDRYRPEVAAGVSRGRFAAIMNHLSLALRDSHSQALDLAVNYDTLPGPGVPVLAEGWQFFDTVGACVTALDDGSALVYSAVANHPLGLEPGDRIIGYDGKPWRQLYQDLLREELPLSPGFWGSSPSSFDHTFVMSAGTNWGLFDTMDIAKHGSGTVVHKPTSLMPGIVWHGFCTEQMDVPGVPKPGFFDDDAVSWGVVPGTRTGYIYVWGWPRSAEAAFAEAVDELTQRDHVDGLIIDLRANPGGYLDAPFQGLGVLFEHPAVTIGFKTRSDPTDHFKLSMAIAPRTFKVDFDNNQKRIKASFDGPIAVLVGPGAASTGDFSAEWLSSHPRARTFGKSTATAFDLPSQPALGSTLDLGPGWEARIAEANAFEVGDPQHYLTHREFPVDQPVWLTPADVAAGRDTVVDAALGWLATEVGP